MYLINILISTVQRTEITLLAWVLKITLNNLNAVPMIQVSQMHHH